jgi:hypothetical protein
MDNEGVELRDSEGVSLENADGSSLREEEPKPDGDPDGK